MRLTKEFKDYEIIDAGNGEKLEDPIHRLCGAFQIMIIGKMPMPII